MKTVTGEPLKGIGSELVDADAPVVLNADVLSWFQRRGFTEKESNEWATDIFRDREETFLGVQEVVELSIALDKAEFTEMYIRFLLTKTTPDRISRLARSSRRTRSRFRSEVNESRGQHSHSLHRLSDDSSAGSKLHQSKRVLRMAALGTGLTRLKASAFLPRARVTNELVPRESGWKTLRAAKTASALSRAFSRCE